jgi:rare lipoprotein A
MFQMTAAHKTLPIPCYVRITNLDNARSAIVRVNDRGPFHSDRILDVSYAAALKLGMLGHGTTPIEVETIDPGTPWPPPLFANAPSSLPQPISAASKPVPPAASSAPSVTPTKTASRNSRFLQAGSFADPVDAATMRDQLEGLGIQPVQLRSEAIAGGYRYRVLIGPFADSGDLDATRSRLGGLRIAAFPFVE